ncbi:MAG: hypothetical protein Q7S33_03970 [Nanoarchaeota archaeon]|nr:hypothetical protein [Nanoarchaeota archaeon]
MTDNFDFDEIEEPEENRRENFRKNNNFFSNWYFQFFNNYNTDDKHLSDEYENLEEEEISDIENERCEEFIKNMGQKNFNWSVEYSKYLKEHPDANNYDEIEDSPSAIGRYGGRKRNTGKEIGTLIFEEPNALEIIIENMIEVVSKAHLSKSEEEKSELKDRFLVLQKGYKNLTGQYYALTIE